MADPSHLTPRATQPDAATHFAMARAFHCGCAGVRRDLFQAELWYQRAALMGHVDSQVNLAILHLRDKPREGLPKEMDKALRWLGAAAEKGDAQALFILGELHERGDGVPRDAGRAFEFFLRSAVRGDARAQSRVALHYLDGDGTPPNDAEAARWLAAAADQGEPQALYSLAVLHAQGRGVPQDSARSEALLRRAAEAGSREARSALALLGRAS